MDIIILSDTRLNSGHNSHGVHNIEKEFSNKGYSLLHNSKKNSRGVGILVSKKFNFITESVLNDNKR
jgi:hypothetical protein